MNDKLQMTREKVRLEFPICLVLVAIILVVYAQSLYFPFINLEDPLNIVNNPYVQGKITLEKIYWAFTDGTWVTNYWAPLLWLSFLFDHQLYGLNAGGYHATNIFFHIANTLLLFFVLRRMTGSNWKCFFIAALFAVHPLHVESVAWVTERKDVLSTFFWMLTMWGYVRYTEQPGTMRYLGMLLFFALGLMSKPMLVTLPFVLLLLDFWPLERTRFQDENLSIREKKRIAKRLVWEKVPLLIMIVACSAAAFITQNKEGVVVPLAHTPLGVRAANVMVGYVEYIIKMIWPHPLAVLYPYPGPPPIAKSIAAAAALAMVTMSAVRTYRKYPWFIVGWLWYLGTLVPVIGWVVIGPHAIADRYTYIPLIGLFITISWGISNLLERMNRKKGVIAFVATAVLVILIWLSWGQVKLWQSSIVLFEHAVKVTADNSVMHNNLGASLADEGRFAEAIPHYIEALRIDPLYVKAHINLGMALSVLGKTDAAMDHYAVALKIDPGSATASYNMGAALYALGRIDDAIGYYVAALRADPKYVRAHNNLGVALLHKGNKAQAIVHFQRALHYHPGYAGARYNLQKIGGDK
jgi:protein O-mannosyl-transferase